MMTAEMGTYRWMAPELYSTVTLRQGEKKHYNHKVDAYSFAIVLWELIHNKLPFEGMSNLQAAYAAAFKNTRPSAEDLPEELALIVTSCWKEEPNDRPNFSQIIQMLLQYLSTISPPEPVVPLQITSSENAVLPPESPVAISNLQSTFVHSMSGWHALFNMYPGNFGVEVAEM
ncbi:Serine/threonine-protein kinase HT1 [Glycine max]|nr:Serine/threonine-protein kinase HT1 [Glycine max]